MKDTQFVGLDVHKETISVAVARNDRGDAEFLGTIPNSTQAIAKLLRRLGPVENLFFCYEAGPCGYGIYRQLKMAGVASIVVAPSLVPQRPGERVKTDRRDAIKLARLLRSGELTPVWVPSEEQEALRDLVRAREDAKEDILRKRHQLNKFLLRLDIRPPQGIRSWTQAHRQWLAQLQLQHVAQRIVLAEYLHALRDAESRAERLEREIGTLSEDHPQSALIDSLQCLRGVALVTSVTVTAELGDLTRFHSAKQAMDYVGLVPSEHSSGSTQRRGSITKSGNAHARNALVEAAWHYRHTPNVGKGLRTRQKDQPEEVKQIAWKAQHRLNLKYRRLLGRGKPKQVAIVAVARELVGFMWAIAQELARKERSQSAA